MDQLPKIRWRARRGMREMDQLFDRYLDNHYPTAPADEKYLESKLKASPSVEKIGKGLSII